MAAIVESIEISRRPEDVFSYAIDFAHFPEWQGGVVAARREGDGQLSVGSRAVVTRLLGPRRLRRTEEITALKPPTSWTVRGAGTPFTAIVSGTIEPLDGGRRSRVTLAFEIEARGAGRLLAPLVRRQVRRVLPRNEQRLKARLERGA
jgi:carbon monoxide dehydrogenase subunit G